MDTGTELVLTASVSSACLSTGQVLSRYVEAAQLQKESRIELKDASLTTVRAIVAYLYSGQLDSDFVRMRGIDLLLAAHKVLVQPSQVLVKHRRRRVAQAFASLQVLQTRHSACIST